VDAADLNLVEFVGSDKSIRVAPGETVHAAAAKVGLMIPKACGMGICGTCKVLKLGGEVEMEHNGGITEEDEAEGYILSCCSVPKGMCGSSTDPDPVGAGPLPRHRYDLARSGRARTSQVRKRATRPLRSTARRDSSALAALV
jgi:ferredoxin